MIGLAWEKHHKRRHKMSTVGERIRDRRQKLHMTQKELADQLGIAQGQLSNYERVIDFPSDLIAKAADALHCSTDYLVGRTEVPESSIDDLSPEERAVIAAIRAARSVAEINALALHASEVEALKHRKPRSKRH